MTEIFKSISQINPEFMWLFFKPKKLSYNLRKGPILNLPRSQSIYYGTNAFPFRGFLLLKLNPAIQLLNLKPKLKTWEIVIMDV